MTACQAGIDPARRCHAVAALVGALQVARSAAPGSVVVTIFPDSGDKYVNEQFWKDTAKVQED
jgi:hypothetical protein